MIRILILLLISLPTLGFFDPAGNINPNSWQLESDNPSTFNASYYFGHIENNVPVNDRRFKALFDAKYINGHWRTRENTSDSLDWSLDEKIGALAFYTYTEDQEMLRLIPIFPTWDNDSFWSWFRPDVLAFTLGCKYPWSRWIMAPVVYVKILYSMEEFYKNPLAETSGVQLNFLMASGWEWDSWINDNRQTIEDALDIYYPEENHPTRRLWDEN